MSLEKNDHPALFFLPLWNRIMRNNLSDRHCNDGVVKPKEKRRKEKVLSFK